MLAGASPAGAAVTIGSDLTKPIDFGAACVGPCTQVPRTIPDRQTTAPSDGVVVHWTIKKSAIDWGVVTFRVMREASTGPVTYVGAGTSASQTPPQAAGTYTFPTMLPIRAGDYIGIEADQYGGANNQAGVVYHDVRPPPPDGGPPSGVLLTTDDEVFFNADVEPDCDQDGFGDETQDPDWGRW